jgi:hypothetical protein
MKRIHQWALRLLPALLSCFAGSAWAAEVSDSLKELNRIAQAVTYTYNYPSKNAAGEDVVLSSALVAWLPEEPKETDSIESLHIYSHFTITADHECPSSDLNLKERALFAILLKDSYGMGLDPAQDFISHAVIIAPDFEGYGATKDVPHPYLAQELTAQQVMDAVEYGLQLYKKHVDDKRVLPFKSDWRSFGFGFSQGGAVALAVQRYMEEHGLDEQLRYRGTLCGDGPYDLIATLRYYVEDDGDSYGQQTDHRKGMNTMPMVVPMIIKGMIDTHPDMKGHQLTDYLSQQFLDTGIMDWLESKEYKINDIHEMWYDQLQEGLDTGEREYTKEQMAELFDSPRENRVWAHLDKLFTPGFYEYMIDASNFDTVPTEKGDAYKDFHRAMADNSVSSGWEPKHRIQFVHSKGDMVVPYANYLAFRDAHPDGEGTIYRIDDSLTDDHIDVGVSFYLLFTTTGDYGKYFQWFDESGTTGIHKVQSSKFKVQSSSCWYDLSGRKLSGKPTQKGVYIYKGKKQIIK